VLLHGTGTRLEADAAHLPVFALFLQNQLWSTLGRLDPPMWSLAVEATFYALLPLAGWLMLRRGPLAVAALGIAAGLAWTAAGVHDAWDVPLMRSLPTFLPVFSCGIAAAALAHRRPPGRWAARALLVGGGALVLANAWWHSGGTGLVGHVVLDLPAAVGFAAIIAAVAHRPPGLLSTRPLRALGDVSYGVYLWHYPVLMWWYLRDGAFPHDRPFTALAQVLVPTLAIATLSWLLVERPVLRWAASATRRPARRGALQPAAQPAGAAGG
jgi:peptidoglycan/LPS O-acetylase OafA/YrhL